MLFKTKGLVINSIKFKESSLIVNIFTQKFGLQAYIVNSVRSKKSRNKAALFQPMSLLELVVYKNEKKSIQRISEFKASYIYTDLTFNIYKSTIALFLSEIINKTCSEEESQDVLFTYLEESLKQLDILEGKSAANFHLLFLTGYLYHLGIHAEPEEIIEQVSLPLNIKEEEKLTLCKSLKICSSSDYQDTISLNNETRRIIFNSLITFLQLNISGLNHIKSIDVIREIFH